MNCANTMPVEVREKMKPTGFALRLLCDPPAEVKVTETEIN